MDAECERRPALRWRPLRGPRRFDGAVRGYDTGTLERELKRFFGTSARMEPLPRGARGGDSSPRVFVVSKRVDRSPPSSFLFRNYEQGVHSRTQGMSGCTLWEAARATSAAPSYFAPYRDRTGRVFIDGGIWQGCPAQRTETGRTVRGTRRSELLYPVELLGHGWSSFSLLVPHAYVWDQLP